MYLSINYNCFFLPPPLGQSDRADTLRNAIVDAISNQNIRTPDIGGMNTTQDMVNAITSSIVAQLQEA